MSVISVGARGSDQRLVQNFQRNSARVQTSVERLSTGKRINRPSDDPAGFVAAEGLRTELTDLKSKLRVQADDRRESRSQESGLADIQGALTQLRDRVNAVNDPSFSAKERNALLAEIDEAAAAYERVVKVTGVKSVPERLSGDAGLDGVNQSVDAPSAEELDARVKSVQGQRVAAGTQDRIGEVFENLYRDQIVITTETLSMIEDTDFAAETANLVQSQVLTQSAMAALGYSNQQRIDQIKLLLDELA
jgi:flagellin